MRDYCEEASLLDAVARHLAPFRVLITYNGRSFDQPLLETRYRLNRSRPPFSTLEHLDLLHGARRLWKLRYESCRLVDLETHVLGFEREGDVPGALIPYLYFEYLRTHRAARLLPVFHHNATDILTLACLTGIVPLAFKDPESLPFRHGSEMAGIARWLRQAGDLEQARVLFRRAIYTDVPEASLPDDLLFRTLWDLAALERKLGAEEQAVAIWNDLAAGRNPFRVAALEELAKYYEHRQKNPVRALEITRAALDHHDSPALRSREKRLVRRTTSRSTVKRSRLL
jgi:tetratricopeptide (TPR) repeat protein